MKDQSTNVPIITTEQEATVSSIEENSSRKLQLIANGTSLLAIVFLFLTLYSTLQTRNNLPAVIGVIFFLLSIMSAFIRVFSLELRGWFLVIAFGMLGISGVSVQPFTALGLVFLLASVFLAAILLPHPHWRNVVIFEVATALVINLLHSYGLLSWENVLVDQTSVIFWGSLVAVTAFLAWMISSITANELSVTRKWLHDLIQKNNDLVAADETHRHRNSSLEELLDRKRFLSITARQINRDISVKSTPDKVMQTAVELISKQFNYYHTGIFLKDERSEFAVLKAGTGEAGAEMLARQHKLRIREEGVVGYVVSSGETRIAADITEDLYHYKNPLLPLTASEMAVPLLVGDEVIGALDVQSTEPNAFSEETVDFLQEVAATLASSIHRTMEISALDHELSEIKKSERAITGKSWRTYLKSSRRKLSYRFDGTDLTPTGEKASSVGDAGNNTSQNENSNGPAAAPMTAISVPIKLRDQVLGSVNLKIKGAQSSSDITQLVTSATDRLALALENARLLEEIQERAERERLVAGISDRVRSENDIDAILKTTIQELGKNLGVGEVSIQLKTREAK